MTLPVELDGKKPDIEFLNELTETLGLQKRLNHLPNELSGGQQQRVAIGRALMNRPAILLADEPTGNLDSKASAEIMELLKVFNRKYKQTLIMITHDLELAKQADRVLNMEDGRLQEIHCWNEGSRKTPVMEVTQKNPVSVAADDEQESR